MDLQPLDAEYVKDVLSRPPFVRINGVDNVRDLGSYPTSYKNQITTPGLIFRAAEISGVTEEGKAQIRALGIKKIFDLRSDIEIDKYNASSPKIEDVDVVRYPVFKTENYSPEMIAKRFKLYSSGKTEAFMELYSQILDHGNPSFAEVLRHVRDRPKDGFLFHCTAGKDRTGVLAAILLKLAGVPDEMIAQDYSLTRVGREPAREKVMKRLAKEPLFASNNEAVLNMFTCRSETMVEFLSLLNSRHGGVENYLIDHLKFSKGDVEVIRRNLLSNTSPTPVR